MRAGQTFVTTPRIMSRSVNPCLMTTLLASSSVRYHISAHSKSSNNRTERRPSYNLKHRAEDYHERHGGITNGLRTYVSNGMLLAAAYHLGLRVRRCGPTSMSGYMNVSERSVRKLDDERKPSLPQPDPGEYFRVLGHSNGSVFYLPVGMNRVVTLQARAHTPVNLLRLAPLSYWRELYPPQTRRAKFNTRAAFSSLYYGAGEAGIFELNRFRQP